MLWWFAQTTMVASVLALLAALASRWRRIGPEMRHALWLVVLMKMLMPPFVGWPWPLPFAGPLSSNPTPGIENPANRSLHTPSTPEHELPTVPFVPPQPTDHPARPADGPETQLRPRPTEDHLNVSKGELPGDLGSESVPARPSEPGGATPRLAPRPAMTMREETRATFSAASLALGLWWVGTALVIGWELRRIARFGRMLRHAGPAPAWLEAEVEAVAARFGVRTPPVRVAEGLPSPLLWCPGRARLYLPRALLSSLSADRWRGVVAHEMAHLARRDHWVARLELAAEALWWWNPLFWAVRRRLRDEAERACDARVVRAWPSDRLSYAEALVDVCERLSRPTFPSPALGIGGGSCASRSLEERLSMILRDPIPPPAPFRATLAIALLAGLALPAWTLGQQPNRANEEASQPPRTSSAPPIPEVVSADADDVSNDGPEYPNPPRPKAADTIKPTPDASGDGRLTRMLLQDPEMQRLAKKLKAAQEKQSRVRTTTKDAGDPALRRIDAEVKQLEAEIDAIRQERSPAIRERLAAEEARRAEDAEMLRARRDGKAAELRKAEALRDVAAAFLAKYRRLMEKSKNFVSTEELARAEGDFKVAEAECDIRKAALEEAEVALRRSMPRREEEPAKDEAAGATDVPARSSLADLRDAVELLEVQYTLNLGRLLEIQKAINRDREQQREIADKRPEEGPQRAAYDRLEANIQGRESNLSPLKDGLPELELRLKQAKRRLAAEEVRLRREADRAKVQLDRAEALYRSGRVSIAEFEAARYRYDDLMFQLDPDHEPTATPEKP